MTTPLLTMLTLTACIVEEDTPYIATDADISCADTLSSTGEVKGEVSRMQAVGDSILGWSKESGESIPDITGARLNVTMQNNAVGGATLSPIEDDEGILDLYEPDGESHVLVNGGGNDFGLDCSVEMLDSLVSADLSSGVMVELLDAIAAEGAQAVIVGYYVPRDYEVGCAHLLTLMERYRALGEARDDTMYVCTLESITPDDAGLYSGWLDPVHPSPEGSAVIGELVADLLRGL